MGEGARVPHAHGAVARVRHKLLLLRDGQHATDHVTVVHRLRVGIDPHRPEILVEGVLVFHLVRAVGHVRGRLRLKQHVVCELIPVDGAVAVGVDLHEEVRQLLVREILAQHLAEGLEELIHVQAAAAVDVSAVERRLQLHELMQVDPVLDAAGLTLAILLAVAILVWLRRQSNLWRHAVRAGPHAQQKRERSQATGGIKTGRLRRRGTAGRPRVSAHGRRACRKAGAERGPRRDGATRLIESRIVLELHAASVLRIRIYRDMMLDSTVVCRRALGCEWGGVLKRTW